MPTFPDTSPARTLLVVVAHPDDETIGTGGTLARYAHAGVRTVVVTCTSGEVGRTDEDTPTAGDLLGGTRQRELREALDILGVHRSVQLGYRDSGLLGWPENEDPCCFLQADLDAAAARLVRVIRAERPEVILTHDAGGGYGHPDHQKAHQATVEAFRAAGEPGRFPDAGEPWQPHALYVVVFPRRVVERFVLATRAAGLSVPPSAIAGSALGTRDPAFGVADDGVSAAVDVSDYVETKLAALRAHRTQAVGVPFFLALDPADLRDVWSHEYFQRWGGGLPSGPAADLFVGIPGSAG